MRLAIALLLLTFFGCSHQTPAAAGAALNLAIGAAAAGTSRALGGCYAACPTGTTCNPKTGLCDTIPCHGRCSESEHCDISGLFDRCVPGKARGPDIEIGRNPSEPRTTEPEDAKDPPAAKPKDPSP